MTRCPSQKQLQQLLANQLPGPEDETIQTHVQGCAACQRALEQFTRRVQSADDQERVTSDDRGTTAESPADASSLFGDSGQDFLRQLEKDPPAGAFRSPGASGGSESPAGGPSMPTLTYQPKNRRGYTLTRLHAKGGLGEIWVARDDDLGREVALKELRPERADHPGALARFLEEAKITGQLEHPGIVPVYHLAKQTADQKPFYTMRFIRGRTLSDAVRTYHQKRQAGRAGPLDLRELLAAFVSVCQAVAYAHSRGVIHRDLKGPNIVLGDFGEVVVLDWGLAKAVGARGEETSRLPVSVEPADSHDPTMQGQVLGTPAYMAPEQAEGRLDQVDERSDVYGLGAVLYEVLTGQPPFSGSATPEVLKQVVQEPPLAPRQRVATTPPALEAVCLKALAKKAADRYASARDLAREIQHWLADEPLAVYPDPWSVKTRRWLGRHRILATATAATVVVATLSLALATGFLKAANDREHQARARAETNFQQARDAVDKFFTKVGQSPRLKAHDLEKLRRDLLQQARDFYEQFVQEPSAEPGVQAERGRAYSRLARITADIASNAEAIGLGQQAQEIFEQLARDHPDVPDYRHQLIKSFVDLGILYEEAGQPARAQAAFDQALPISEQLTCDYPGLPEYQHQLGNALYHQGFLHQTGARLAEAKTAYERALSIFEGLTRDYPKVPRYQTGLAVLLRKLGGLLERNNQLKQAQAIYERAVPLCEQLARDHPDDPDSQHRLADMYDDLGILNLMMGKQAQAKASFETALPIRERLARDHPTIGDYQWSLAQTLNNLASVYKDSGEMAKAEAAFDKALPVCEKLVQDQPDVANYQEFLVIIRQGCAGVRAIRGDHARAAAEMEALTAKGPLTGMALYGAACVYALSSAAAAKDVKLSQAERSKLCEQYAARALQLLEQTQAIGYFKTPARVEELKRDSDFGPLRTRDDFKKLLQELEKKAKAGGTDALPVLRERG